MASEIGRLPGERDYDFMMRSRSARKEAALTGLADAIDDWDAAYEDVITDWPRDLNGKPIGSMTEERLKIFTRNRMRERGQQFPEIARWRLRIAVGFRSEEE